jgi:4-amino-4-deoxy-L-arabinose transferase-like glycosyltransferase
MRSQTNQLLRVFAPSCFVVLVAFAIRLWALGAQSLWFDEGWSWHLARMPLTEMALTTAGDRSPPLYYALLHTWIALAGQSEFAMRFISALADTATVALLMAFAGVSWRGAGNAASAASLIAGAIYAVCPFAVWYAQETRMYALVATLCTASSYALRRWLCEADGDRLDRGELTSCRRAAARFLVASAVLLGLAIYSHYYAVFLLPAHFLVVFVASVDWRAPTRASGAAFLNSRFLILNSRFLLAAICVIGLLIPWLLVASAGFAYDDGFSFPLNTIDGRLLEWVRGFAGGGLAHPLPDTWPWLMAGAGTLGLAAFAINRRWLELARLLALIIGPLLAATIAVRLVYPYRSVFHPRYLIYVVPMVCALFGAAGALTIAHRSSLVARASSILRLAPCLLIGALWLPLLGAYFTAPALWRDDTRSAVRHVVEAIEPGDLVVMSRDNFAITYYWPPKQASSLIALPPGLHGVLHSDAAVIGALNDRQPERVRLMLWQDDVVDPQKFIESTLWPNGYQIGEFNFARIRLPLYRIERRPIVRAPFQEANITFGEPGGDRLVLRRYWQPERATAGDWFYAVLEWEAQQPLNVDYKVFIHVVGADGRPVFQNDRLPLNALLPMTRWRPGEVLRDAHAMVAPAGLPTGIYPVVTGVYDPHTGQRLPAYSDNRELGTAVSLGAVALQLP